MDSRRLGYVYQDVNIMWLDKKPKLKCRKGKGKKVSGLVGPARAEGGGNRKALSEFPITLKNDAVSVVVARPKAGRSKAEKEEEEEILVIEGVDFDCEVAVKFEVYLNDEDDGTGAAVSPDKTDFAGTFENVPHKIKNNAKA